MTDVGTPARRPWTWAVTVVLHLLAGIPYAVSGVVVEAVAHAALIGVWALLGVAAVLVHRRWGGLSAVVPALAVVTWFAVLTVGDQVLGWTA